MRVLHVTPSFGKGGMERVICSLVQHLDVEHQVLSLDGNTGASGWIDKGNVRVLGFSRPRRQREFFRLLSRVLKEVRPHVLMTYNWGATDAVWLGRIAGIRRIIHSEHGYSVEESRSTLLRRDLVRMVVYRLASKIVVVSKVLQRRMQRKYLVGSRRIELVYNGVDTGYYAPEGNDRLRTRGTLGFGEDNIVIGFVGRLDPVKNVGRLIDVFARCVRDNCSLRLLVVGDGSEKERLAKYCENIGVDAKVVFIGEQGEVLSYLRAMDIFMLTSVSEQMPMSILEAMAVGLPVVATAVGEIPSIIDQGISGFCHDPREAAETFNQSLSALIPRERRETMKVASRKKALECFTQEKMLRQYEQMIGI